jgi:hypothetical protein
MGQLCITSPQYGGHDKEIWSFDLFLHMIFKGFKKTQIFAQNR